MTTALSKLISLEHDARSFGFEWPDHQSIFDQIVDEVREVKEDLNLQSSADKVQEEIGDLLHAVISLCIYSGFDVDETLSKTHDKFGKRLKTLKKLTHEHGLSTLQGSSVPLMLKLWEESK